MFETVGPNECMVVSGKFRSPSKFVIGGKAFVWPGFQKCQKISLNVITCIVNTNKVYSEKGVPLNVSATAQVKIKTRMKDDKGREVLDHFSLRNACRLFLSKQQKEVKKIAELTLEGHQRAVIGTMTVEEVYQDRKKFSKAVRTMTEDDLAKMGLELVSYTISEVSDDNGYLKAIGEKRTAEVQRDARIGEAENRKNASIERAKAQQVALEAKYSNLEKEAASNRDFKLKESEFNIEVETKKAEQFAAHPMQTAISNQQVMDEKMKIQVVERQKEIQLQEQEIIRVKRELEGKVEKVADAEKYQMEQLAHADYTEKVLQAKADAEALQARGKAEAYAIQASGEAEAEAMLKKAKALQEYKGAAMLSVVLDSLPKVAAEISTPLSHLDKLTMIAGDDGDIGASRMTNEVLTIMNSIPNVIKDMTGVDMTEAIARASRATSV